MLNSQEKIRKRKELGQSIINAVIENDMDKVLFLLESGACLNTRTCMGMSLINLAASRGLHKMVNVLLENGAKIHDKEPDTENTPLHFAVENRHDNVVETLLKLGADVDTKNIHGYTPLMTAFSQNQIAIAKMLLKNNANLKEATDKLGTNPLHIAVKKGHLDLIALLIEHGADIECRKKDGLTALLYAVGYKNIDALQILIDHGANVNTPAIVKDAITPLQKACADGSKNIVEMLLKNGVDIEAKNSHGKTALRYAVFFNKIEIVELLVKYKARINGSEALHCAAKQGFKDTLKILLENGGDINDKDQKGLTTLYCSSYFNKVEIVEYLIENRMQEPMVLHAASINGSKEVLDLLLAKGCKC